MKQRKVGKEKESTCVVTLALLLSLSLACRPDVDSRACDDNSDCFAGERCVAGTCETTAAGDTSSDLTGDGDVRLIPDRPADLPDIANDPAPDGDGGTSDQDEDRDRGRDTPEDRADDHADTRDLPEDAPTDRGGSDSASDSDRRDSDLDGGSPFVCGSAGFARKDIELFEPCAAPSLAWDDCSPLLPAYGADTFCSSWRRTDEPLEIPLRNGIIDDSVTAYFRFDGAPHEIDEWSRNSGRGFADEIVVLSGTIPDLPESFTEQMGQAARFDGTATARVDLFPLAGATEWTVALFFRYATVGEIADSIVDVNSDDFDLCILAETEQLIVLVDYTSNLELFGLHVPWDTIRDVFEDGWIHLAVVAPPGGAPVAYVNGVFTEFIDMSDMGGTVSSLPLSATTTIGGDWEAPEYDGDMDELLFVRRALSGSEIRAYLESRRPYGSVLLPYTQSDYDDVRASRCENAECTAESAIESEVIGVRPSSEDRETLYFLDFDDPLTGATTACGTENPRVQYVPGRFGHSGDQALRFLGENPYCDTGLNMDFSGSFTIEGWFYFDGPDGAILYGFHGAASESLVVARSSGTLLVMHGPDAVSGPKLYDYRWYHIGLVRDVDEAKVSLFVDGVRVKTRTGADTSSLNGDGKRLYLGSANPLSGEPVNGFNGRIDDFAIFDRALDAEEIRRRALPRVPTVRFLVSTNLIDDTDPCTANPYPRYRLYWGNTEAAYTEPTVCTDCTEGCIGLLSSCNGYAGWWRFDRGYGNLALDHSSHNRNALIPTSGVAWAPGIDGTALHFDGTSAVTTEDKVSLIELEDPNKNAISIEAPAALAGTEAGVLVSHEASATCRTFSFEFSNPSSLGLYFDHSDNCESDHSNFEMDFAGPVSDGTWRVYGATHLFGSVALPTFFIDSQDELTSRGTGTVLYPAEGVTLSFGGHSMRASPDHVVGAIDSIRIVNGDFDVDQSLHYPLTRTDAWAEPVTDWSCHDYPD